MKRQGLTLIEVLIALAVIGIAFGALLMSQVSNLRASAQSRYATDAKAAAVRVLEAQSAEVLKSEVLTPPNPYIDDPQSGRSFYFVDYFYSCPTRVAPPQALREGNPSFLRPVNCQGEETQGNVAVRWRILGESGVLGEGVVTLVVTAAHERGPRVTIGRRVTCYDVYPSPTQDKPAPCPPPRGGRP
ncbi:type IV pilus modification PilV family protein [Thermus amyloliquefaciens]|uniref:type IV pilus modification PilV family protein n=1 Tax=Thermus amyloliquefaciens TaxID=1449080 RepID=UPI0005715A80|nr:type II secretion system protein [Thermus amyloliquefaciens]